MAIHYESVPRKPGDPEDESRFNVWYDDPEKEDPNWGQQGQSFYMPYDFRFVEETITLIIEDAEKHLPPGTVFEIRGKQPPEPDGVDTDFGRIHMTEQEMNDRWGVAWYHERAMHDDPKPLMPRVPVRDAEYISLGGYLLIARLKTPDEQKKDK